MSERHETGDKSREASWAQFTTLSLVLAVLGAGLLSMGLVKLLGGFDDRAAASATASAKPFDAPVCLSAPAQAAAAFSADLTEAHARMHHAMSNVVRTGDPDRDFMLAMLPHHQGALEMAQALLKVGSDERVKRLAQSMLIEQAQEIAYMRILLDRPDGAVDDFTRP